MTKDEGGGKRRRLLRWMMIAVLVVIMPVWAVTPGSVLAADSGAEALQETAGLSDEARKAAYENLRFDMQEWTEGLVLSRHPLAVVTEVSAAGEEGDEAAIMGVWTGLIARADDDLIVVWDELRLDAGGTPAAIRLAESKLLPDYFAAEHQRTYRTAAFIGRYPWAYIPTDPEAAEAGIPPVAQGGIIDLYGNDFGDAIVNRQVAGPVASFPAIPDRIIDRPSYTQRTIAEIPADIVGHWAEPYTLSLMRLGIVDGYEDGTVRPGQVLSRAEFVKLALTAALLPLDGDASVYPDVAGHWAESYMSAAEIYGVIPQGDGATVFQPDEPVSRTEMAVVLQGVLAALHLPLPETPRHAIEAVAGAGILTGFEDGTFRPNEPLTRAQAFVAIAKLVEWL